MNRQFLLRFWQKLSPVTDFIDKYGESWFALILYSLLAMLGWMLMWSDAIMFVFGLIAVALALSCKRGNALFGVFGLFMYCIMSSGYNLIEFGPLAYAAFVLILGSFGLFMIKNKVKPKLTPNFYGIAALNFVMLAGGGFNYASGWYRATIIGLIAVAIAGFYFLLSNVLTAEGKRFYVKTMLVAGLIICLQMFILIIRSPNPNAALTNKSLWLGWGITNCAGIILVVSICCALYLATTAKHPTLYLLAAFAMAVVNVLTFSRASVLVFAIIFIPLSVIIFIKTKSKKEMLISYVGLIVCGGVACLLVLKYLAPDFGNVWDKGLSGNGREALYAEAILRFRENYIWGIGYAYIPTGESGNIIYSFHNTWLQFLASGGILGLIALIMHKAAQYKPFLFRGILKGEPFMLFAFIIIASTSFWGLMDVTIWTQHYMIPVLPLMAIVDDITKRQYPEPVATKNKKLKAIGEVKIKIATLVLAFASFGIMITALKIANIEYIITLKDSVIAIVVFIALYIAREFFRTLGYITLLGVPVKHMRFGKSRKSRFLYGHNTAPMYARDMLLVELYPVLMTAAAPMVCATIMGNMYMMLVVAALFACSASDLLLVVSLAMRSEQTVQDHPTIPAYYINYPEETEEAPSPAEAEQAV